MKQKTQTILGASAASLLALSAFSQEAGDFKTDSTETNFNGRIHNYHPHRLNDSAKSSDIIGMTVKNFQGEKLGKVEDLAVDLESGRIVEVILSSGGFIGIGDRLTAVPPEAFSRDLTNKCLELDADKEKVKSAPVFEMSKWSQYGDSNHLSAVYSHYGQESSFAFIGDPTITQNRSAGLDSPGQDVLTTNRDINTETGHRGTLDGQQGATDGRRTANVIETNVSVASWNGGFSSNRNRFLIPESRLGHLQKASKLTGETVDNLQGEKLGEVKNLLVDLPSGRVIAVVITSGGFLGMDGELSAVPPTVLRFNTDWSALQLDATKEMMSGAPHFQSTQWPDAGQPEYAASVYQAYNAEPYFSSGASRGMVNSPGSTTYTNAPGGTTYASKNATDNAVRHYVPDRDSKTLTPLDQGNSEADIATTAQIRKDILADNSMSTSARNVKIITMNGHVTLRGTVNTPQEKQSIGEIANRAAQPANVENQLVVQPAGQN